MLKIALINMPFTEVRYPSIALTQLKSVVREKLGDRVDPAIHYFNHDFAEYFGPEYERVTSLPATVAGLGDWMFRHIAFPDAPDNADSYFRRHAPRLGLDEAGIAMLLDKRAGLEAHIEELIDRHQIATYGLTGFTTMFSQNVASFAMARMLKQRRPDMVTVMGGANCETSMGRVIAKRVDPIDFVFSGPALVNFPEFVTCVIEGRLDDAHRLTGVLSKRKVALSIKRSGNEVGEELSLDQDVTLDYDDFLASFDRLPTNGTPPHLFFETSRGCWWGERSHCTFCGLNGSTMSYRAMAADKAVTQFDRLFAYAPRVTRFDSVDNILPIEYLTEVLPRVKPPEDVEIFYEVKANLKDREMQVLADAGVRSIQPGIEALSTTTLKLMKKGTTAFQNLKFLKSCRAFGITPIWGLLIGFPGEEEHIYEKYLRDLPRFVHLPPPSGVYPVRFDRYSPYYTKAEEYGLDLKPYDFYGQVYPFTEPELDDLAYFFIDQNIEAGYASLSAKWITALREAVGAWQACWRDQARRPQLTLSRNDGAGTVADTRSGEAVEHRVGEIGVRLLDQLESPKRIPRIVAALKNVSESQVTDELAVLTESGIVFEEDGLFMSLLTDD